MSTKARVIAIVLLWAACSALLVQSGSAQPPPLPPIPVLPKIQLPPIPGLPLIPGLPQIPGLPRIRLPPIPGLPRIPLPPIPGLPLIPDSRPSFDSRLASDSGAAFTSYPWTAVTSRSAPGTGSASTTPCPRPVFTSTTPNSRRSSCRTSSGHNQCWTAVANAAGCVVDITPLLHRQLSTVGPACCKALIQ
uniref:Prolamin-like domain-containing protein n=1 Tax=Salix viminalis TaxID=40686 RepID=A0A6N2M2I9_SALVM